MMSQDNLRKMFDGVSNERNELYSFYASIENKNDETEEIFNKQDQQLTNVMNYLISKIEK